MIEEKVTHILKKIREIKFGTNNIKEKICKKKGAFLLLREKSATH